MAGLHFTNECGWKLSLVWWSPEINCLYQTNFNKILWLYQISETKQTTARLCGDIVLTSYLQTKYAVAAWWSLITLGLSHRSVQCSFLEQVKCLKLTNVP